MPARRWILGCGLLASWTGLAGRALGWQSGFRAYWNVPTFKCHRFGVNFTGLEERFGILQNQGDQFRGDRIAILYDPGDFPALLKDNRGHVMRRNGGVPQEGNLTLHLEYFKRQLVEQIPDKEFSGLGVIDFESWRPIFRQNWASLQIYRDLSLDIERRRHPFWGDKAIQLEATSRFESAGKIFVLATLEMAKRLRPMASWGYYAYPYCYNLSPNQPSIQCAPKVQQENDGMSWLFGREAILLPSVYLQQRLSFKERVGLVRGRVKEAVRLAAKAHGSNPVKVLAYYWFKYQDQPDKFVEPCDLVGTVKEAARRGADGVILWGSSSDVDSESKCRSLEAYLADSLGPAILGLAAKCP